MRLFIPSVSVLANTQLGSIYSLEIISLELKPEMPREDRESL